MRVLDLALKDLLQIVRDRKSALFLVLMPVAFTLFFGFVIGNSVADPRLPVGWVDLDKSGSLSAALHSTAQSSDSIRLVEIQAQDVAKIDEQVRSEKLAAAVIVPAGFSERMTAGENVPLTTTVLPGSMAGQTASTALTAALRRVLGAVEAARLSTEAYQAQRPFADDAARQAYMKQALDQATAAWQSPPLAVEAGTAAGPDKAAQANKFNGFLQSSPGMMVMFSVFSLVTCAMVLVLERKSRALQRLMTTPISRAQVIGGHVLAMFVVVFVQLLVLVVLGQLFLGVDYLREALGILLVMAAVAVWVACLGLFIGAISKGEEAVVMWSLIAMFLFAALGGAWFPLEVTGPTFSAIGHFTPGAWAMDGFQNIVLRGLGLSSVLLPVGLLLVYAALFFGLAVWRFKFE